VVLERVAAPEDGSSVQFQDGLDVRLNLVVCPREDRSDSQVFQATFFGLTLHSLKQVRLLPIFVHKEDRLRGALLARVRVRILVALPRDVVNLLLLLGHVWPKDFPVESPVFELYFPGQFPCQMLANSAGSCEKRVFDIALNQDFFHGGTISVKEVQVFFRQATVVEHADPLLKHNVAPSVTLNNGLVAHEESAHHLQDRDFNWEVEWRDDCDAAVGPSVARVELSCVIARLAHTVSEPAHLVATEVFVEVPGHIELSPRLEFRFGHRPLDHLDEEVHNLRVVQGVDDLAVDLAQHQVALLVLKRVVETRFRNG
jgi:hypothetical protein